MHVQEKVTWTRKWRGLESDEVIDKPAPIVESAAPTVETHVDFVSSYLPHLASECRTYHRVIKASAETNKTNRKLENSKGHAEYRSVAILLINENVCL